jgi:hypothetical protein
VHHRDKVHHCGIPTAGAAEWKHEFNVKLLSFDERDREIFKKKEVTTNIEKYLEL